MMYEINIKNTNLKFNANIGRYDCLNSNNERRIKLIFKKIICENYNVTNDIEFIHKYLKKLEVCGFCNKNPARYLYDIKFDNRTNTLDIYNIEIPHGTYKCINRECIDARKHLNPNSFEYTSKSRKISILEAKEWIYKTNSSPFYKNPNENILEYKKRQRRDLNFFITKYGEIDGKARYYRMLNKISTANKKENMIKKHGKEKAEKICKSKAVTLENLTKLYGYTEAKIRYEKWIKASTIAGIYFELDKAQSKQAYNFFVELTKKLKFERIIDNENDVIYKNAIQKEQKITYFNEHNKLRWFELDYLIKKYSIIIEYNGSYWHPSKNSNRNFDSEKIQKESLKWNNRINILNSMGYIVLTVWDYEYNSKLENKEKFMLNFIEKIKGIINEKLK